MTNRLLLGLILVVASGDLPVPRSAPDANGARIFLDDRAGTLVLDLAPIDLPANTPHHALAQPPVATLEIPERSEEHTSELQSRLHLVCRLLLEKKKKKK